MRNVLYTLSAAQRTTVLNAMANLAYFTATYELTSYDGSTQIGTVSSYNAKIQTTSTNSKPSLSGFTFADINEVTLALTENDQLMVQTHSSLRVICNTATAKNGYWMLWDVEKGTYVETTHYAGGNSSGGGSITATGVGDTVVITTSLSVTADGDAIIIGG